MMASLQADLTSQRLLGRLLGADNDMTAQRPPFLSKSRVDMQQAGCCSPHAHLDSPGQRSDGAALTDSPLKLGLSAGGQLPALQSLLCGVDVALQRAAALLCGCDSLLQLGSILRPAVLGESLNSSLKAAAGLGGSVQLAAKRAGLPATQQGDAPCAMWHMSGAKKCMSGVHSDMLCRTNDAAFSRACVGEAKSRCAVEDTTRHAKHHDTVMGVHYGRRVCMIESLFATVQEHSAQNCICCGSTRLQQQCMVHCSCQHSANMLADGQCSQLLPT